MPEPTLSEHTRVLPAVVQLALKAGVFYDKVSNVVIWGNHSTTQVGNQL